MYFIFEPPHGRRGQKYNIFFVTRLQSWTRVWVQMSAESNLNCEGGIKKIIKFCTTCAYANAQKEQDKGRNLVEDWSQNEEICYHSKQRTRQVFQISPSMGMIRRFLGSFCCSSQLLFTSQLPFVVLLLYCFY